MPVYAVTSKGKRYRRLTDESGAYSFAGLPAGKYRIQKKLPRGLSDGPSDSRGAASIPVTHNNSQGAGCQVDGFARPDGLISGKVVDRATGKGVAGFVTLEPVDPAEAKLHRGGLPGDETVNGSFTLPQLPPGKYRLLFKPLSPRWDYKIFLFTGRQSQERQPTRVLIFRLANT